jgi:hypothetical protein
LIIGDDDVEEVDEVDEVAAADDDDADAAEADDADDAAVLGDDGLIDGIGLTVPGAGGSAAFAVAMTKQQARRAIEVRMDIQKG